MNVPRLTIIYGLLLIILGAGGYVFSGAASFTALIPAFLGIVLLILGVLARREIARKQMMHLATILSLIGFIATVGSSADLLSLLSGGEVARPAAVVSKSIMSVLSLAFFIVCLLSFVIARAERADATES